MNRWMKRGLGITGVNFATPHFGLPFWNQGAALVNIYKDGSVLVNHGGIEMGQGLTTKCHQIASRTLNVPMDQIYTQEANTSMVPNAIGTNGSTGTDMFGTATMLACEELNRRLAPFKADKPDGSWQNWITAAYMDRVSLSATGFHKVPNIELLEYKTGKFKAHATGYWTVGAGVTEVELDCLTGDVTPRRVDIVMDVGTSINPAIDVGQIEGGYVQGYGNYMMEDITFSENGEMLTTGPNSYKIPTCKDIPIEMNVTLLKDSRNKHAVYSSKAIGEPPLFLAMGAHFAAREAVKAARADNGCPAGHFRLDSPATQQRLLAACGTDIKKHFTKN